MERKSSIHDLHIVIKSKKGDALKALYKTLSEQLGENHPFAKFSIGEGFYLWSDTRCVWQQMIAASDLEQVFITEALLKTKHAVAEKIGWKIADALFTIPDNSYIYYNNDDEDVKILLTAWGFKNPVNRHGGPDTLIIEKKNPITISFSYDNVKQSNYEFGIQLPKQIKRLRTDTTGVYQFPHLKVGERFVLKDLMNNRDFALQILDGKSNYDFDITQYTTLVVKAFQDTTPILNKSIDISYHGNIYTLNTGATGNASLQLPFYSNEIIVAKMDEQEERTIVNELGNEIEFNIENPQTTKETQIEVTVLANGEVVSGIEVEINYAGHIYLGVTDSRGLLIQKVEIIDTEICTVSPVEYESQSKPLVDTDINKYVFNKDSIASILEEDDDDYSPYILVLDCNGQPCTDYPINVEYDSEWYDYISDGQGIVYLPNVKEGGKLRITDKQHSTNIVEYILEAEKMEYIYQLPEEKMEEHKYKMMFRDFKEKPLKCNSVHFCQSDGLDEFVSLDEEGNAYFSQEAFDLQKEMHVSIDGAEQEYDDITFSLDENEYEYLLQEQKRKSQWWMILLQIFIVFVVIILLLLLWPFFREFCYGMFNLIYN